MLIEVRRVDGIARWRPLAHWAIGTHHLLLTGVLSALSVGVAVLAGAIALVTGRVPAMITGFQVMTVRERVRCFSHFFVLRPDLPPVNLSPTAADPGDDPRVVVGVLVGATGGRRVSHLEVLARPFVLVPHLLVLLPIGFVMDACYPLWMLLVAANGGWPSGMARLLSAVERWVAALALYATFAVETRPSFGLVANGYRADAEGAGVTA
jgi:hypothetical protein